VARSLLSSEVYELSSWASIAPKRRSISIA
jgi:hypothetical protein